MQSVPDNLLMTQCFSSRCCLIRTKRKRVIKKSKRLTRSIIVILKEQFKLLHDRIFGRKSEQTVEPNTPQLAFFSGPESESMPIVGDAEEEVVAPAPRRGKPKPLSTELPSIEVIHELPEHELTCACGCRKHAIGE